MTLAKVMSGVALGWFASLSLTIDAMDRRDAELLALREKAKPLQVVCPEGTVKVATQGEGATWNVRCVGRGKARVM